LPKHREDFGQTLGKWGAVPGPYVVLPVFGPSTLRDTLAFPLDLSADPWFRAEPHSLSVTGAVVRVIDQRAALLDASTLIEEAALDRYEFVRDAYLQRRENRVYDGDVPIKKKYDPDAARKSRTEGINASSLTGAEPDSNGIVEAEHSASTAVESSTPPSVSFGGNAFMIKKQTLSTGNTTN
jgi:phospholipid-binding lipoprotein MlaA